MFAGELMIVEWCSDDAFQNDLNKDRASVDVYDVVNSLLINQSQQSLFGFT